MKKLASKALLLLTASLLILLALPAGVLAGGGELTQTVDGYQVTLVFEKPAFVGENQIRVLVKDAMNLPVSQADLEVSVEEAEAEHAEAAPTAETGAMSGMGAQPTPETGAMSGMGGMSAQPTAEVGTMSAVPAPEIGTMTSDEPAGHAQMGMVALTAGQTSGEYRGTISIESDGDQLLRVHLTVAGKLMEVDFPLQVAKSKTGAIALGSFFAVDAVLIAAAFVMKSKSVSKKA
jgi:hypothetical protein